MLIFQGGGRHLEAKAEEKRQNEENKVERTLFGQHEIRNPLTRTWGHSEGATRTEDKRGDDGKTGKLEIEPGIETDR